MSGNKRKVDEDESQSQNSLYLSPSEFVAPAPKLKRVTKDFFVDFSERKNREHLKILEDANVEHSQNTALLDNLLFMKCKVEDCDYIAVRELVPGANYKEDYSTINEKFVAWHQGQHTRKVHQKKLVTELNEVPHDTTSSSNSLLCS